MTARHRHNGGIDNPDFHYIFFKFYYALKIKKNLGNMKKIKIFKLMHLCLNTYLEKKS